MSDDEARVQIDLRRFPQDSKKRLQAIAFERTIASGRLVAFSEVCRDALIEFARTHSQLSAPAAQPAPKSVKKEKPPWER